MALFLGTSTNFHLEQKQSFLMAVVLGISRKIWMALFLMPILFSTDFHLDPWPSFFLAFSLVSQNCEICSTAPASCSGPMTCCSWVCPSPGAALDSLFGSQSVFRLKLGADVFYANGFGFLSSPCLSRLFYTNFSDMPGQKSCLKSWI